MNCGHKVILKIKEHKHTQFELEQLMKKKPLEIAQALLREFGDDTISIVSKYLPESLQKEIFIGDLRNAIKYIENKKWNAKRGRGL